MWLLLITAIWRPIKTIARNLWRIARQLFHEVTGLLFGVYALGGCIAAWREWRHAHIPWVFALMIFYSLMMAWFAFDAFRSARRVK